MKKPDSPAKSRDFGAQNPEDVADQRSEPERDRQVFVFGPFSLDVAARTLRRGSQIVPLTPKPFDVLVALVREYRRVVGKDELFRTIWPGTFVSDESLTQTVSVLRKALGESSEQPTYIATIPRVGYQFVAKVQMLTADAPPPVVLVRDAPSKARQSTFRRLKLAGWAVVTGAALVAVGIGAGRTTGTSRDVSPEPVAFEVTPPDTYQLESNVTLSPDGRRLAMVVRDTTGRSWISLRSLESVDPVILDGTEGGRNPFWAPDGQSLAFFAGGRLLRTTSAGGPIQVVTDLPEYGVYGWESAGGTWGSAGIIVFAPHRYSALYQVPASGGKATVLLRKDVPDEGGYRWPLFLPDSRRLLFAIAGQSGRSGIYVSDLDGMRPVKLLSAVSKPLYARAGFLVYGDKGSLMAQPFDATRLQMTGSPLRVHDSVARYFRDDNIAASIAQDGTLAFVAGKDSQSWLTWYDRSGRVIERLRGSEDLSDFALSPDGSDLVGTKRNADSSVTEVWALDLQRGVSAPLITEPRAAHALWSPDGRDLAFTVGYDLYRRRVLSRAQAESRGELLIANSVPKYSVDDWAPDGRSLIYTENRADTRLDLWLLPLDGDRTPVPLAQSSANEYGGQISPDGRWLAYVSDESGAPEVYVRPLASGSDTHRLSAAGGSEPRWRHDATELFYIDGQRVLVAASVRAGGGSVVVSRLTPLFQTGIGSPSANHYRVAADGQRFLLEDSHAADKATLILHWTSGVQRLFAR